MVMHGALVLMFDVLDYLGLPNAACAAALKVLWQLSFNHASKIKESKKLLDVIRELKVNNYSLPMPCILNSTM